MKLCVFSTCTLGILLLTGCSGGGESVSTIPASGTVTLNSKPLADADVIFHPAAEGKGRSASGKTDAQGKFKLSTYYDAGKMQDGAVPGEYSVTVNKVAAAAAMSSPQDMMKAMSDNKGAPKKPGESELAAEAAIPENYANPKSSGLKATVKQGDANDFPLELKGS